MKRNSGFTLIEIMVVVAIIAILAAIAYPQYVKQLQRSTRSAAQAVMMDAANKEQFYLASQRQYSTALSDLNITLPDNVASFYDVVITADNTATPPLFTITANPKGRQLNDGSISLDSTGQKLPADKW